MPVQTQLSFMLDATLYKQSLDYNSLSRNLEKLIRSGINEFRIKLLLNNSNIIHQIYDNTKTNKVNIKTINKADNYISVQLDGEYGRKNKIRIVGKTLIIRHPIYKKVWISITDSSNDFLKKPFRYFLRTIHPRCAPLILTTPQIEQLLKLFQKNQEDKLIRVKQIGQRTRIRSRGAIKNIEADRRWTDLNIDEIFSEVREAGQWITDIFIEYGDNEKSTLKIGRFGEFVFRGQIKSAFEHFVNSTAGYGEKRYNFLSNRQKSKETKFTSRPFQINFNSSVFSSKEQFKKLSDSLRKIPATSFTILHSNPYFHASMVDYKDGSNYEVLIMNQSYLTIIPQGRSTVRALQRLCTYIFSNFREGEIVEEIKED